MAKAHKIESNTAPYSTSIKPSVSAKNTGLKHPVPSKINHEDPVGGYFTTEDLRYATYFRWYGKCGDWGHFCSELSSKGLA